MLAKSQEEKERLEEENQEMLEQIKAFQEIEEELEQIAMENDEEKLKN